MKTRKKETAHEPAGINDVPHMPAHLIKKIDGDFADVIGILDNYNTGLDSKRRRRLNGADILTQGFIKEAYELAVEFPDFLPVYTPLEKFKKDYHYFLSFLSLLTLCDNARKVLWNITLQAAHYAYADARDFYREARAAKNKGISGFENVYNDLFQFFRKDKKDGAPPTQAEVMSDVNALLRGKKDGEVIIRNVSPKKTRGRREVIDEVEK
jgi:hypothetical protein